MFPYKKKINIKIRFEINLDMHQYCEEVKTKAVFTLHGLIVHSGQVEFGHYVSYNKINNNVNNIYICSIFVLKNFSGGCVMMRILINAAKMMF